VDRFSQNGELYLALDDQINSSGGVNISFLMQVFPFLLGYLHASSIEWTVSHKMAMCFTPRYRDALKLVRSYIGESVGVRRSFLIFG
jgi:hypothetical protein